MKKRKRKRDFAPSTLSWRWETFSFSSSQNKGLLLELFLLAPMSVSMSYAVLNTSQGTQRKRRGKLMAYLMALQILILFPNPPAPLYFSNSSLNAKFSSYILKETLNEECLFHLTLNLTQTLILYLQKFSFE